MKFLLVGLKMLQYDLLFAFGMCCLISSYNCREGWAWGKEVFPTLGKELVSFLSPHSNTQNTELSNAFHLWTYCS